MARPAMGVRSGSAACVAAQRWEAGAGGADGVVWFGRLEEEEDKR